MPDLRFDDTKDFDDNVEAFLRHMESKDANLGAILRVHIDSLKGAYDDRTRRDARTVFNEGVVTSLDEILIDNEEEELES